MSGKFTATVEEFVATSEKRMLALARESIQRTIDDAQTPTGKGGRMRVKTGFLRASGLPSYNGLPTGPTRGDPKGKYDYDDATTELALAKLTLGSIFYFGWVANYAKYREAYDGFLSAAAQKWPETVARVTEEIKRRVK